MSDSDWLILAGVNALLIPSGLRARAATSFVGIKRRRALTHH